MTQTHSSAMQQCSRHVQACLWVRMCVGQQITELETWQRSRSVRLSGDRNVRKCLPRSDTLMWRYATPGVTFRSASCRDVCLCDSLPVINLQGDSNRYFCSRGWDGSGRPLMFSWITLLTNTTLSCSVATTETEGVLITRWPKMITSNKPESPASLPNCILSFFNTLMQCEKTE